ncbi:MAG: hypothetical protein WA728_04340 [Xanthobacteraceae bacterium]
MHRGKQHLYSMTSSARASIALAKRIGAKATALTVLPPFHTFTTDTQLIEDTPARYKARRSNSDPFAAVHEPAQAQTDALGGDSRTSDLVAYILSLKQKD